MLTIHFNTDTQDQPLGTSAVDYVELDEDNDVLVISNGSLDVADGEAIPSEFKLIQAAPVASETDKIIVSKYFIADSNAGILKQVHNMGNYNKRYIVAFDFDAATASEPILEVWDDTDMDSIDFNILGAGNKINSWVWGIVTTNGLPGANWVGDTPTAGHRLAGSASSYFLNLNDGAGALEAAATLYCQLKVIVPANPGVTCAETPAFVCKYTTN